MVAKEPNTKVKVRYTVFELVYAVDYFDYVFGYAQMYQNNQLITFDIFSTKPYFYT